MYWTEKKLGPQRSPFFSADENLLSLINFLCISLGFHIPDFSSWCHYSKNEALQEYWKHFDAQCICMGFDIDFSSQGHQILFYPKYDQRGKTYPPFFVPQDFKYPCPIYNYAIEIGISLIEGEFFHIWDKFWKPTGGLCSNVPTNPITITIIFPHWPMEQI